LQNEEAILSILRNADKAAAQKSLADEIGYSVGKVNYVLKALIDKGFIKADNFITSDNKRKYTYLLTPAGIEEKIRLTEQFIVRKKAEYEELQSEPEVMRA
jgi:EPS-associated MarR family transcriptional regulator